MASEKKPKRRKGPGSRQTKGAKQPQTVPADIAPGNGWMSPVELFDNTIIASVMQSQQTRKYTLHSVKLTTFSDFTNFENLPKEDASVAQNVHRLTLLQAPGSTPRRNQMTLRFDQVLLTGTSSGTMGEFISLYSNPTVPAYLTQIVPSKTVRIERLEWFNLHEHVDAWLLGGPFDLQLRELNLYLPMGTSLMIDLQEAYLKRTGSNLRKLAVSITSPPGVKFLEIPQLEE
ncbi:uncharacterized protein FIBRA_02156 [Fibroporia radiculosa]|uniref:Uncharacterized protein n=1 Tax=Fibroporia radiculosa TaxID=599839 RepID=J4H1P4_9APHY|nr:uncharacterized protein FIBRA_02156 [Fibroporia radiculosa]CCM00129.1 predicted protein [Fibroporia radiculosa]